MNIQIMRIVLVWEGAHVGVVVKALCYKLAGRGFPMVSLEFFIDMILPVDSTSNRNEYQVYFLGVEVASV